jgi:hypothetical protein
VADYQWKDNMACVATYTILEGDKFLDQFEDTVVPFSKAGALSIGKLRYYPKTTSNINIIGLLALQVAQRFLTELAKTFTVKKELPTKATSKTIEELAAVFASKTKTLRDLAEIVDNNVKFPDEK